jgi:hypothetical protein
MKNENLSEMAVNPEHIISPAPAWLAIPSSRNASRDKNAKEEGTSV